MLPEGIRRFFPLLGVPSGGVMADEMGSFRVDIEIENLARLRVGEWLTRWSPGNRVTLPCWARIRWRDSSSE
jgi:hypothetical protein